MTIIDHLSVGVPNVADACPFYDAVLETIGAKRLATLEPLAAYGSDRVEFVIILPNDGGAQTAGNGVHVCFVAPSQDAVDAFHKAALANGGTCAGEPGPRPGYPKPDVYAAFVHDPYGNKLEAIYNGFAA